MAPEWVHMYDEHIFFKTGQSIYMAGNNSFSQNLKVALEFAIDNIKMIHNPVLFVVSCQNYNSPLGIRMNNEAYTSYPSEQEYLLQEGCPIFVLGVEHNVLI